ncbi:MAG: LytTR family DNA-binding domain-containing protein [Turicibacter sp.]|nr:LytTR family DNA-binding domain-containing protein [Turicibacter sp.]
MKKFHFAILDDERIITRMIKEKLEETLKILEITDYKVDIFNNGLDLLEKKEDYDVVLLDLKMPGIDGMTVAKEMMHLRAKQKMIILTSESHLMSQGYHVNAHRFLTKPLVDEKFLEAISSAIDELKIAHMAHTVVLKKENGNKIIVDAKNIVYIEAFAGGTQLRVEGVVFSKTNQLFPNAHSLKHWKEAMPVGMFVQTHNSFLANVDNIKEVESNFVIFKNEDKIDMSRRMKKNVIDTRKKWYNRQGGVE